MTSAMDARLYVVVLNWNRPETTLACVQLVTQSCYPDLRVIVVDNASSDDSVARISGAFPGVPLLQADQNLGYAGGNNLGIRYALARGADYIVLLNDDVFVDGDTFRYLVGAAEADTRVAAAGCRVLVAGAPERIWAAGECLKREPPWQLDDRRFDTPCDIDYAVGCCILLRREALQEVGLLDTEFFAIYEEFEWCYRARMAGYRIRYVPEAIVRHQLDTSLTAGLSPVYHYLSVRNQLRCWQLQGILPSDWRRLRGTLLVWYHELRFIQRRGNPMRARLWGATRGTLDFLRGHFGPPPVDL